MPQNYLNSDVKKFVKTITLPVERENEIYDLIPENAIIIAEDHNLKTVRIRYTLSNTLTPERIKELNSKVKPVKLRRKNEKIDNSKNKTKRVKCRDNVMVILNIADFHLNRRVWGYSGFDMDYSLQTAKEVFMNIIDEAAIRLRSCPYNIEKIILNTSGDFLNSDTVEGTTTKGTNQDDDTHWANAFLAAQELLQYGLIKLSSIAPVEHYYVGGNHDEQSGWYLVSWAKAFFKNDKNIYIDENPKKRQTISYGNNLIILAHGDTEGKRSLSLPFVEPEAKAKLSEAKNIEVLTGHVHKVDVKVENGVRWEVLSTSCPVGDQWTYNQAFGNNNTEATLCYYNQDYRIQQDIINTKQFLD